MLPTDKRMRLSATDWLDMNLQQLVLDMRAWVRNTPQDDFTHDFHHLLTELGHF
jgi:hypothetical protein